MHEKKKKRKKREIYDESEYDKLNKILGEFVVLKTFWENRFYYLKKRNY